MTGSGPADPRPLNTNAADHPYRIALDRRLQSMKPIDSLLMSRKRLRSSETTADRHHRLRCRGADPVAGTG